MHASDAVISANLSRVQLRMARAAQRAGRDVSSIRLVAVSKTHPIESIRAAVRAGQTVFGENRVQEGLLKIGQSAGMPIEWHLIGHLQSNKARKAAAAFSCVHSVDGIELLDKLDLAAAECGTQPVLLVQADLAGEPTKHGAAVDALSRIFDRAAMCRAAQVRGLMVLPPLVDDPEDARPYFRRLREIRDELLGRGVPLTMLRDLSMGMSHDFEVAVEEGATLIRVGSAIFGART